MSTLPAPWWPYDTPEGPKMNDIRELKDEIDRLKKVNLALRREIARLRNGTAERG